MNRTTFLGRFSGIDVSIHWTFYLFFGWIVLSGLFSGGVSAGGMNAALLFCSFLCVLLHEFGHAFAARAFGISTE
ncbi:MAG: hypothetical protein KDB27_32155, partial [Planctomycetales bacterium]|nr:hypothetical protein [Planctomycetales bacterium]